MVASSLVHVLASLLSQPVKIVLLLLLALLLPLSVMPQANQRSSISAKEMSDCVLQLLNVFQVYVTQFQWVQLSLCKQDLQLKF
jgi:fumarate reductase subunit D